MRGPPTIRETGPHECRPDDRAVSAVVGKALEAGIVVLYVAALTTTLYGGVIPEYETAAGAELGERVLAEAAIEVQTAVPEDPRAEATVRYELPETIDGSTYSVRAVNGSLALDHPDDAVGGTIPLALPPDVEDVRGSVHSHQPGVIRVERTAGGRIVELVPADEADSAATGAGNDSVATATEGPE